MRKRPEGSLSLYARALAGASLLALASACAHTGYVICNDTAGENCPDNTANVVVENDL